MRIRFGVGGLTLGKDGGLCAKVRNLNFRAEGEADVFAVAGVVFGISSV